MAKGTKNTKVKKYSIDQLLNTESIITNSISFDEKYVLFSSDKSGIYNAYIVSLEDNSQQQVTYDNSARIPSIFTI
jgi:Tol biopolymer transport system component